MALAKAEKCNFRFFLDELIIIDTFLKNIFHYPIESVRRKDTFRMIEQKSNRNMILDKNKQQQNNLILNQRDA